MNDYEILKDKLPIPFVMEQYGLAPDHEEGGKLIYHSPFREDKNPSFDVWMDENRGWRWGDFAEGTGGDVIDLLNRFEDNGMAVGWRLVSVIETEGWTAPEIKPRKKFDALSAAERMKASLEEVQACIEKYHFEQWEFTDPKPGIVDIAVARLYHEWKLSADGDALLIPYYDEDVQLVNYKVRTPGEKRNASGGTHILYGLWRLNDAPIVLVEGETDTWAAQQALGPGWCVLGIPGAGTRPERVGLPIAGRDVVLAVDADEAGGRAVEVWSRWVAANGGSVSLVPLPSKSDVASLTHEAFRSYFDRRSAQSPPPVGFTRSGEQYGKYTKDENFIPSSSWALDVTRVLESAESGEVAYEGVLLPHRRQVILPASAMMSSAKIISWCTENAVQWTGGGQDHQKLAQLLAHQSFGLPVGRLTTVAGLHEGTFVWPGGHAGDEPWMYTAPRSDAQLSKHLHLSPGPVDRAATVAALLGMYDLSISTPLLAWLAAAPLRSLFKQFPFVYVGGTRGSGKTVTPATMMELFNGSTISEAAGSTEHALQSKFSSTNAFPIRIDEFRRGAIHQSRRDALMHVIRAAYDGEGISKGGQDSTNLSALTEFKASAPFILSGEDSLVDEAILDRAIILHFVKDLQGQLPPEGMPNLGLDYLEYLLSDATGADLRGGFVRVDPTGPEHLSARQRANLGVLVKGWRWLQGYIGDEHQLPKLDLSRVVHSFDNAADHNPLVEAIRFLVENPLSDAAFYSDEGKEICIQPTQFMADIKKTGVIDLPFGSSQGLVRQLVDDYGANPDARRISPTGEKKRVVVFDSAVVE